MHVDDDAAHGFVFKHVATRDPHGAPAAVAMTEPRIERQCASGGGGYLLKCSQYNRPIVGMAKLRRMDADEVRSSEQALQRRAGVVDEPALIQRNQCVGGVLDQ